MKKYMVIDCYEREINEPKFFDTEEKAQIYLFELFFDNCYLNKIIKKSKWEKKIQNMNELRNAVETLQNGGLLDDDNDYNYGRAWCNTAYHDNWDGRVIEVNI